MDLKVVNIYNIIKIVFFLNFYLRQTRSNNVPHETTPNNRWSEHFFLLEKVSSDMKKPKKN